MTKTKKDLMLATYGLIFDQTNPTGMKDFKRYALPHLLRQCPSLSEPLTDEEFDRELQKIRDNLPEIIEYLRRRPLSAALTPDNNEINPPVNSKDILNFPPGDFVIGDDGRGERILAKLGLLKFMTAPPAPRGP